LKITLQKSKKNFTRYLQKLQKKNFLIYAEGLQNNNIFWNIALHTVVTQQILHINLADFKWRVADELVAKFMKGTHPRWYTRLMKRFMMVADFLSLQ